jgi:hypothetical protein
VIWLGTLLALLSAVLVNLGLYVEHRASSAAPRLQVRRPIAGMVQLLRNPLWLSGYGAGCLGWASYIVALWFAPLWLVQGVAAAGIGVLALLVRCFSKVVLQRGERLAVAVSLVALVLIAGTARVGRFSDHRQSSARVLLAMAVILAIGGLVVVVASRLANWGSALGAFGGICYAAGDVATKAAVDRDGWIFVVLLCAANMLAFLVLQLSFQRGSALGTAGVSTVLTNALPIAAAILVFGERLAPGARGVVRVIALAAAVASAGVLAATSPTSAQHVLAASPVAGVPDGADDWPNGTWSREDWSSGSGRAKECR